ncbi:hypothetical protein K438DRAFT_1747139 [Mycena galopus ATCC 62051]|nr:hypothetical protein K438DRAFT_1747139 [Mycena galopus ATCC 62051]
MAVDVSEGPGSSHAEGLPSSIELSYEVILEVNWGRPSHLSFSDDYGKRKYLPSSLYQFPVKFESACRYLPFCVALPETPTVGAYSGTHCANYKPSCWDIHMFCSVRVVGSKFRPV